MDGILCSKCVWYYPFSIITTTLANVFIACACLKHSNFFKVNVSDSALSVPPWTSGHQPVGKKIMGAVQAWCHANLLCIVPKMQNKYTAQKQLFFTFSAVKVYTCLGLMWMLLEYLKHSKLRVRLGTRARQGMNSPKAMPKNKIKVWFW